jgi:hypothetical protein
MQGPSGGFVVTRSGQWMSIAGRQCEVSDLASCHSADYHRRTSNSDAELTLPAQEG